MKYIKLLFAAFEILIAISVLMGYQNNIPIMLLMLAISNAITAWESYHKNKRESILLFLIASFLGIVSIFIMFF